MRNKSYFTFQDTAGFSTLRACNYRRSVHNIGDFTIRQRDVNENVQNNNRFRPCLHGVGDPGLVGKFLLFCVHQSVKTKETNPTRPGSPTPCKQALKLPKTDHLLMCSPCPYRHD